ncbi:protein ARABIDILLO 2-like isoform X1 [Miscanthus floridulus]|uniref:protein ARABIDILLO 2-like isoform X1 n=2 Tax=Miscanthus floridulus TaxID=154761 RepID=UPI00345A85A9
MIAALIAALLGLCVAVAVAAAEKRRRRVGGAGDDAAAWAGLSQGIGQDHGGHWCISSSSSCSGVQEMSFRGGDEEEETAEELLERVRGMVPPAAAAARAARGFPGRWKAIAAKLDALPACLSDLSSHPCFARNALCRELLQSVAATLADAAELAARCREPPADGKLRTQSAVDALSGRLDLGLRDCALLVKTGVLSDAAGPSPSTPAEEAAAAAAAPSVDVRELLARLQIGHAEAKGRAVDGLLDALRRDERSVLAALGRASVSAMVQLLTASAPVVREKAATVVCQAAESGGAACEALLVTEGVLPPLIRLAESGSLVAREKAVLTLQRLSASSPDVARAVVGHGGAGALVEICQTGDSVSQTASAGALRNLSAVPEVRQALADEGVVRVMVGLLDRCAVAGAKEHAAECLQNLTSGNDGLRHAVVSEGGLRSLLLYLDGPLLQEPAVSALRNLVGAVSPDSLVALGVLPRLVHVLRVGSIGAQQAAAAAICRISSSAEMKRAVGEHGCIPLLVRLLEDKSNGAREVAAQALASLVSCPANAREMKKDDNCVPGLVQLLDPSPANTAKKYAIAGLLTLSGTKRCKKVMVSHGAIGYLKKLSDMDVAGAKKLHERLEGGRLRSMFSRQ